MIVVADFETGDDLRKALSRHAGTAGRKSQAKRRLAILDEEFKGQIRGAIEAHYKRKEVQAGISRHVTTGRNLLLRVVDEIAAPLYETPPARTIDDADEGEARRLAELVELLELDTFMQAAAATAFACNIVHIVPVMLPDPEDAEKLVPALELVTPDVSDVILEHRRLQVLVYDIDAGDGDPRKRLAVDANGWHYLDEGYGVVESTPAQLGRCPAVEFRLQPVHRGCYWGGKRGEKLEDVTIQVGRIDAHMGWVRESLNAKILAVIANSTAMPAGTKIDPKKPIHLDTQPDEATALVLDLEVRVKGFVEEMREKEEPVLESYGLPAGEFNFDTGQSQIDGESRYGRRKKIRNRQLATAKRAERELMHRVALVLGAYGHDLGIDPEVVRKRFQTTWTELTFADHPLKQLEIQNEKIRGGYMSPEEAMLEWRPDLTIEEATERIDANLASRGRRLRVMAEHNMPDNPRDDANYVAELQGKVGQLERDANKREDEDDDPK